MDIRKLRRGDAVEVSVGLWHGSMKGTERHEGISIHIGPSAFGDLCLEVEMPISEYGKLVARQTAVGTVNFICLPKREARKRKAKKR